jgi:hypothetical protein
MRRAEQEAKAAREEVERVRRTFVKRSMSIYIYIHAYHDSIERGCVGRSRRPRPLERRWKGYVIVLVLSNDMCSYI